MSVAVFPSDAALRRTKITDRLSSVRVVGGVSASFAATDGKTRLVTLAEHGGYRAKFPGANGTAVEAVIVNTGGGVAGGDRVRIEMSTAERAHALVTTTSAERIYRSLGPVSEFDIHLSAGAQSSLAWLPQPSILFSSARLRRRFEVDLASDASFVMAEAVMFGRIASGEAMGEGLLHDVWRIRRDGTLVFAEASRIDGNIADTLARPAVAGGVRGVALLVASAPGIDERRDSVRAALSAHATQVGVSAWNGLLVLRAKSSELQVLQLILRQAVVALQICPVPHLWPA